MRLTHYKEGLRIYRESLKRKKAGFTKYEENAEKICEQIIEKCWNGKYYQTSTHNFKQFWTRDFGWCAEALIKLGHKSRVKETLKYALEKFFPQNVTTTITPKGKAINFPTMAVDSLPYLLKAIQTAKFDFSTYQVFLEKQVEKLAEQSFDLVKYRMKKKHFSSMKDFAKRKGSCYDYCMLGMLSNSLNKLGLNNPFEYVDFPRIVKRFWNGTYFYDDESKKDYVAGDANIFPFYCEILKDYDMLRQALESVENHGLTHPMPLKYNQRTAPVKYIWQEMFLKNYETDAIWTHMGPIFIQLTKQISKHMATKYKKQYTKKIEEHGTYVEVFNAHGKPYQTPFYYTDEGMLWAANYLKL